MGSLSCAHKEVSRKIVIKIPPKEPQKKKLVTVQTIFSAIHRLIRRNPPTLSVIVKCGRSAYSRGSSQWNLPLMVMAKSSSISWSNASKPFIICLYDMVRCLCVWSIDVLYPIVVYFSST